MQTREKNLTALPPSKKWYLLSLLVFIICAILSGCFLYKAFTQPKHVIEITPQTKTIQVASPGKYTLWIIRSKRSTPQASEIKTSNNLPTIFDQSTIVFKSTSSESASPVLLSKGWHFETGEMMRFSLGDVVFDKSGTYSVAVSNPPKETYLLYLHKPNIAQIIKYLILSLMFLVIGVVLSILIALIVFVKRTNILGTQPIDVESLKKQSPVGTGWAMATHLSGFAGLIFPFGNIIVPLFMWAVKRHESPFIDFHGKEAINFQISVSIYYLICIIMSVVIIGLLLMPLLAAFQIVAMIIAAVAASHGNLFHYPLSIRFIK